MILDALAFAEFNDQESFADFLGGHEIAHQQIAEYLSRSGSLSGFSITNGGSGYSSVPAIVLTGGGGSGAAAKAGIVGKVLTSISITSAGTGYSGPPNVSVVGGGGFGAQATAFILNPSTILPGIPLSENPKTNPEWLMDHYTIHLQIASVIGQSDLADLSDVNLNDEGEYLDWMQLHAYAHDEINTALGILS